MSAGDPSRYDDKPGSIAALRALLIKYPNIGRLLRVPRTLLHSFTIPYLSGISSDGRTVYIDQHIPVMDGGINFAKYLEIHESVERAIWLIAHEVRELVNLRKYEPCHHLATAAEHYAVLSDGHTWEDYTEALRPDYSPVEDEELGRVPPDLMTYPYAGKLLRRIQKAAAATKFTQQEVNYREAPASPMQCRNCWKFLPKVKGCQRVDGLIDADDVCDKWELKNAKAGT
jgi:hypothetical protein